EVARPDLEIDAMDAFIDAIRLGDVLERHRRHGRERQSLVCARPASTIKLCPVMPRASSDARKSAVRATSSSESRNLRHCASRKACSFSGVSHSAFCRSVTTAPGTIELTRMLWM